MAKKYLGESGLTALINKMLAKINDLITRVVSLESNPAQVQSDWNESSSSSKAYIKNKPTIPTVPGTATQSSNGLLSAADKKKLDEIESNANNYVLPEASDTVLGGVKIWKGTESEYNALTTKDNKTIYLVQ